MARSRNWTQTVIDDREPRYNDPLPTITPEVQKALDELNRQLDAGRHKPKGPRPQQGD